MILCIIYYLTGIYEQVINKFVYDDWGKKIFAWWGSEIFLYLEIYLGNHLLLE